jgi:hypothetical protein
MKLSPKTRRWILLAAAPLVAVAALRSNGPEDETTTRREPAPTRAASGASRSGETATPSLDPRRLQNLPRRHASEQPPVDPFAVALPPPPPAPPAALMAPPPPPPPPQAPPLPFRYIGRQEANGVVMVFLEQQNETHIVKLGETVADGWRLDALDERSATFTYLPLGQQRRLDIGSAS